MTDIDAFLQSLGSAQLRADSNLYIFQEGTTLVLLLYIDDISMAYPSNAAAVVKNIKAKLVTYCTSRGSRME